MCPKKGAQMVSQNTIDIGSTILIVEDDEFVREELKFSLSQEKFEVFTANDGIQALAEFSSGQRNFCAIVTDINLGPGPNGWEVARQSRLCFPDIPVIYMSGEGLHAWTTDGVPNSAIVSKPFRLRQLLDALSSLRRTGELELSAGV
jgi:DNA-binding response OmpR family regulator